MKRFPLFCTNCAKEVTELNELLFVEETNTKGFCSNECILAFYKPYMEYFVNFETEAREELGLNFDESYQHLYLDRDLFDQVLTNPDEILSYENEIGDHFYLHTKEISDKSYLIVCTHYDNEPAFVYFKLITHSAALVKKFKSLFKTIEKKESSMTNITLDEEVIEQVNLKKSQHLALLLSRRSVTDIDYERFSEYDDCLENTLNDADEIFEQEDEEGDLIVTYIKSFKKDGVDFYYVLLCQKIEIQDQGEKKLAILPILSFPSTDKVLYQFYSIGTKKSDRLKN